MDASRLAGWDRQLGVHSPPEGPSRRIGAEAAAEANDHFGGAIRAYTELGDNEGYVAILGASLASTMEKLDAIVGVNEALEGLHRQRRLDVGARA
jgi:hypothetical protein